jgi:hypothetical protein
MPKTAAALLAFNRGMISPLALARIDLKRIALSAELQSNWMPRSLGSMMLRPGLAHIDSTLNNAKATHIPFVFSATDTAIIELTDSAMRVRVNEAIITRVAVSTAITNGTFDTDLAGWTDADESGATSAWLAGGYMSLIGTSFNAAIRKQTVTVAGGDINKEHALKIVVTKGHVTLRVGSADELDDYIAVTTLDPGTHSLAFTPSGDFFVKLSNLTEYSALVDSIAVEPAGAMNLPAPWTVTDLPNIRWDQSGDIIFLACTGFQQRKIERRSTRSWSVVLYQPEDGPFINENLGTTTLLSSAISGDVTITASSPYFYPTHVGALFRITSTGQNVAANASGNGQFADPIEVTGIGTQRTFLLTISGTWAGTIDLQRSVGTPGSWVNVTSYTTNQTNTPYTDGLDNQIIYYRLGFNTGYTSGTAALSILYSNGTLTGIARIKNYTSPTSVDAEVLKHFGASGVASAIWAEGAWSARRQWPSAVAFYEGRLWWAGKDKIYASVSDAFASFDGTIEGDSGPISRSIGSGPVDRINWLLPLLRLIVGCELGERTVRSSSLDEPVTPTNFNLKEPSTRGSTAVAAAKIDSEGVFVRNSRLFHLTYTESYSAFSDYSGNDLTVICPEIGQPSITRIGVQRYPDTRIHCVRSDGVVAVLVFDPAEDVKCWILVKTDGVIEDVFILPGGIIEDNVYYVVNRTINGMTVRYLEKWALESECTGGALNKQSDSFITYTGAPTTTITGLAHLEARHVVVWGDGKDLGSYVVSGGQITGLSQAVSNAIVGLPYTAQYKSTKLAYASGAGTALTQPKRVDHLGLILQNTHAQGLLYGPDFDHLDNLPMVEKGATVDPDYIWPTYDFDPTEFNGAYDTDSRLCLQAQSPRPCTVLAVVIDIETFDKI